MVSISFVMLVSQWRHSGVVGGCYAIDNAMNTQDAATYQSYLLRLWRDNSQSPWRASLQSSATEELQHFLTAEDLWAFLKAQMSGKEEEEAQGSITDAGM